MKSVYIIIGDCCGEYISAYETKERADEECRDMNADYFHKYGREKYEVITSHLNG